MTPNDIINEHLALARNIAGRYADPHIPNDFDELLSAAYYGLVKVANTGITDVPYIAKCISFEVKTSIRNNHILSRRDREVSQCLAELDGDVPAAALVLGISEKSVQKRAAVVRDNIPLTQENEGYEDNAHQMAEMLEVCLSLIPLELHRAFLLYYRDGYSIQEISDILTESRSWVSKKISTAMETLEANKTYLEDLIL